MNRDRSTRFFPVLVAGVAAAFALLWRVLTFAGFNNDHYVNVARAQQMVLGDWVVRDFVDPGMPLTYAVSAAARWLWGSSLGVEVWLIAVAFAVGAALTTLSAARLSGSAGFALTLGILGVLINPRSFSYPKVALYAGAALIMGSVARSPTTVRLAALALVTAIAFLFRHDHGLFIGLGSALTIGQAASAAGWRAAVRPLAIWFLLLMAYLAPWAIYVAAYEGHFHYWASALAFSRTEAAESGLRTLPGFQFSAGHASDNALSFLFYCFHATPVVALGLLWRRRSQEAWLGERAVISALAVMGMVVNLTFMRGSLSGRVPDAFVLDGLLLAWMFGRVRHLARDAARRWGTAAMLALTVAVSVAIYWGADVHEQLGRSGALDGSDAVGQRIADLRIRLGKRLPERDHVPSRYSRALLPFLAYVERCTAPADRLMVTGLFPEIYVLANRRFAGGHIAFWPPYYSTPAEQEQAIARLLRQSVPFVILVNQVAEEVRRQMPRVWTFVETRYEPMAQIEVPETAGVRIMVEKNRRVRSVDPSTGWVCFTAVLEPGARGLEPR